MSRRTRWTAIARRRRPDGVDDKNFFRPALAWDHPQDRQPAADKPRIEELIVRPCEARDADRYTRHHVGARGRSAIAHPHIQPRVAPGGHEAAAIICQTDSGVVVRIRWSIVLWNRPDTSAGATDLARGLSSR